MRLFSKKAQEKKSLKKFAQSFMPLHHSDDTYYSNFSKQQNSKGDNSESVISFMMGGGNGVSPLIDFIMNPSGFSNKTKVARSDKELLIKAWETSSGIDRTSNLNGTKMRISSAFSMSDLNRLKASGLIAGFGDEVALTKAGRDVLVQFILDDEGSFANRVSSNIFRIIKTAITQEQREMRRIQQDEMKDLGEGRDFFSDPSTESEDDHNDLRDNDIIEDGNVDENDILRLPDGRVMRRDENGKWFLSNE